MRHKKKIPDRPKISKKNEEMEKLSKFWRRIKGRIWQQVDYMLPRIIEAMVTALRGASPEITAMHMRHIWKTGAIKFLIYKGK